ncbi:MAG: PH domain-containing protein [Patescibacteria group bacterium]
MVHKDEVTQQLKDLGANFSFWCRAEIKELPKILFENEKLKHLIIGRYEGGFALLCATDHRVLLIDKKPFYLTIEDIRYDMVSDVQYNHRMIDASIRLGTMHKTITFLGYNHNKLRQFTSYIQEQVLYYRQQQMGGAQPQLQQSEQLLNPATPVPASLTTLQQPNPNQNPVQAILNGPKRPVINPYNMPVMIRRRVSRFY